MSDDAPPSLSAADYSTSATLSASAASWNPAFRPDNHRDHAKSDATTLKADQSDETSIPPSDEQRTEEPSQPLEEQDEPEAGSLPAQTVTEHVANDATEHLGNYVSKADEDQQDLIATDELESVNANQTAAGPEEEPAIFKPDESIEEQEARLEAELEDETEEAPQQNTGDDYEHQGEVLDMEEAVDEAPSAPLLEDPEEPPIVEELKREPTMNVIAEDSILDFDGAPASNQAPPVPRSQPGHIDRSFTTNFTEMQNAPSTDEQSQEPGLPVSAGWPSAGDDKTFGELLGDDDLTFSPTSKEAASDVLHNDPVDDGWGGADDDTFGELLDNEQTLEADGAQDVPTTRTSGDGQQDMAAIWQAALDDDDLLDESNDLDPSAFFGDDDSGFLEDELSAPVPASVQHQSSQAQRTASPYIPAATQQPAVQNIYAASNSGNFASSHGRAAGTPDTGLYDVYGHGAQAPTLPTQRPNAQSSQSFVDKAKGGYQSPYDLPMEVVKQPRQRPRQAQPGSQAMPMPPPRSSSMSSQPGPPQPRPPTAASGASMSPPPSAGIVPSAPPTTTNGVAPTKSTPKGDSGFFADLPIAAKPRSRMSGAYTPQVQPVPTPPPESSSHPPLRASAGHMQPPQRPAAPQAPLQHQNNNFAGLSQPERLPLLPDHPTAPHHVQSQTAAAPLQSQRYSPNSLPAPTQSQHRFSPAPPSGPPPTTSRYSPAPAAQVGGAKKYSIGGPAVAPPPPGIQNSHPFAPRTSSPLAFATDKAPLLPHSDSSRQIPQTPVSPPKPSGTRSASSMSPDPATTIIGYSPNELRTPAGAGLTSPPQRAVTQSPPAVMKPPRYSMQAVPGPMPSTTAPLASSGQRTNFLPHRRQMSRDLNFTPPNNEHANDPLQRWKGYPIFRWNDSGSIVTTFPRQTPFYAAGHGIPSVKCTPGEISIQQASSFMPMEDRNAKFPGPLSARAKGRKKEVLTWMTGKVEDLERRNEVVRMDFEMDVDLKKRTEEKLVLWKLVKIFVEHDGKLESDKKIEDEVRAVLLPNLAQMGQGLDLQSPMSATSGTQGDGIDKAVIIQLRQALLEGNRERAVWLAEEKKLWGHAMLIASTMGPDTWKQIIQSFVRSQVKTVGSDARSLAALYQVFAGNAEECVDELVPPSARAGFQMISKSDGTISGNPLEGLDQWRETLGLVAGNRTPADQQSLLALGKLLSGYGRAEAAHACFLFARQLIKHSGPDDADASFVILGVNHKNLTESIANDLDAIILTEIYEWACSLSAPSNAVHYVPHLQSFKLIHAQELAAYGLKSKAQSYCDHITSAYTSTTRPSPYYHPTFTQAVNDLSAFLSQTPQTGSAGLLSKGAMNKVSSGAASWFTKFVSGDDERESNGASGAGESGPFGRVSGDSPGLSRSGSQADLYNPMMGGGVPFASSASLGSPPQTFAPSSAPSRYAAIGGSNKYAPMAAGGMSALAQRPASPARPASSRSYAPMAASQPLAVPRPDTGRATSDYSIPYGSDSRRGSAQYPGSQGSYEPRLSLADDAPEYGYQPQNMEQPSSTFTDAPNTFGTVNGLGLQHHDAETNADVGGYQAPSAGYEPPTGGYEPPSYQPYQPDPEGDEIAAQPKKKSFMDDDDDELSKQAMAMKKAEADRQADEAFKKAAEADAARDKSKGGDKKGWFGGWFGKKDPNAPQNGPIKAKLGEENSFYYDEDLKKWVNKKGGPEAATPAAATPPPPRGPASRAVSASMGPPSGPPSRVASAAGTAGPPGARIPSGGSVMGSPLVGAASGPPSRTGTPAMGEGSPMPAAVAALSGSEARPPSAPPSRPATGMSSASSLDDLLGGPPGPGQRKAAGTVKGKKKGARYVDVMKSG